MNVLITGANRGLGLEFARQYLADGDSVFAACRSPEQAAELRQLKASSQGRLEIIGLDVTSEASIATAALSLQTLANSLDILINNAGIAEWAGLSAVSTDIFQKVFRTNVAAPVLVTRAMLPLLKRGKSPKVINISSRLGSIAWRDPGSTSDYAYSTSKAALNMVTKQLAHDLREDGIVVVAQSPGWVRTDMGGAEAPLSPTQSVSSMRALIARYSHGDSGRFVDYDGKVLPY